MTEATKAAPAIAADASHDDALAAVLAHAQAADAEEAGKDDPAPSSESSGDEKPDAGLTSPAAEDAASPDDSGEEEDDKKAKEADDKIAPKFAALARKSQKLREREQAFEATVQRVQQTERGLVEREQRVSQWMQRLESLERDPDALLTHLAQRGVRFDQLVEHATRAKDPDARISRVEQTVAERERQLQAREERLTQSEREREQKAARAAVEQDFFRVIGDEDKFEAAHVAYGQDEMLRVADYVADRARAQGLNWDYAAIAEAVDEMARKGQTVDRDGKRVTSDRYKKITSRYQRKAGDTNGTTTTAASTNQAAATHTNGQGRQAPKASGTLTNRDASERDSVKAEEDLDFDDRVALVAERARQEQRRANSQRPNR